MDVALENGCFVDDDGNWVPLDYAEDYGFDLEELCEMGYDPDDLLYDYDDYDEDDDSDGYAIDEDDQVDDALTEDEYDQVDDALTEDEDDQVDDAKTADGDGEDIWFDIFG